MLNPTKGIVLSMLLATMLPIPGHGADTSNANLPATTKDDVGEKFAEEYRAKHPECSAIVEYGKELAPVGQVTGDPEKDTIAYPVERIQLNCPPERSASPGGTK